MLNFSYGDGTREDMAADPVISSGRQRIYTMPLELPALPESPKKK
jgi:hypothetical protein